MVGASSWSPTADRLRAAGASVEVPDVLASCGEAPRWSAWTAHLAELISGDRDVILVGHSAASTLVADLATKIPVRGLVIVDGAMPPSAGNVAPVWPAFRALIDGLADATGQLPPWSQWWQNDPLRSRTLGMDTLSQDPGALATFDNDCPRLKLQWFDDEIDLAPWAHVPAGYIQTSAFFGPAADEAERRGWPVRRLAGTHLHPTLEPRETAAALEAVCRELG